MTDSVQKVHRAVKGIENPTVSRIFAFDFSAFFLKETVAGADFFQIFANGFFGISIGGRNEIGGTFARNLQIFDFAEIAQQVATCFLNGFNHDVQVGGQGG